LLLGGCASFYSIQSNKLIKNSFFWTNENLKELADDMANAFLISEFANKDNLKCYKFNKITNETYEHINTRQLATSIASVLQQSKNVCLVDQNSSSDAIFYGTISAIFQKARREKDMFYIFRLYLIDTKTTQLLWSESKEIRKHGKRALVGW
jgi:PBP1b-binding outer membrane lipoprotein LpoB